VDAAVAADAGERARSALENRRERGFPQRPPRVCRYAIAARISWAVLDSAGGVAACIDSALK
jgi:hypothetical protein